MLYELIGTMLNLALEAVSDGALIASGQDDARQRAQALRVIRDIARLLPKIFHTLERELRVLEAARDDVWQIGRRCALDRGMAVYTRPIELSLLSDPLLRYQEVLAELAWLVEQLHASIGNLEADAALLAVRRGLAAAAAIQGEAVDYALAAAD